MTILITGGAGFIGSHVTETLLKQNKKCIVLDSFNTFYNPAIKQENIAPFKTNPHFTLINGSILDKDCLNAIFNSTKITAVIHLAAYAGVRPSIENPELYFDTNITGTLNILECIKEHGCPRLLFASSSSVYGNNKTVPFSETDFVDNPISPYAASKKAGELLCYNYHHLYAIPTACIRFFTVYGPRQRPEMAIHKFTDMIEKNTPIPVFNNGNCLRDYTHVHDIVQGIMAILNAPNLTYDVVNLGESKTISTIDLIKLIEKELGKKADINLLPAQPGDVEQTYANITHAKSTYHYNPQFPIEKGIQNFVQWYKKKNKKSYPETTTSSSTD